MLRADQLNHAKRFKKWTTEIQYAYLREAQLDDKATAHPVLDRGPDIVLPEERCYCNKPVSVCIAENGSNCHHPHAAAHNWGD